MHRRSPWPSPADAVGLIDDVTSGRLALSDDAGVRHELERFTTAMRTQLHALADAVDEENFGRLLPHRSVLTPTDTSPRFGQRPQRRGYRQGGAR